MKNSLRTLALATLAIAPCVARAQDAAPTPPGEHGESFLAGVRGNVHGQCWDEIMSLKGTPIPPRFPKVGDGIERRVLGNGLVVYLAPDRKLPLVSVEIAFKAGEDWESEEDRGITNALCERMRRGGVEGLDANALEEMLASLSITAIGRAGEQSASVGINTLTAHLDEALDVLTKIVLHPTLEKPPGDQNAGGFGGFGGGGRGGRRGPQQLASLEFRRLVYGKDHPAARDRGGFGGGRGGPGGGFGGGPGRRDRFTVDQIKAEYAKFIRPDTAYLVATGDFDTAEMEKKIETAFGGWPKPTEPPTAKPEKPEPPITPSKPGVYVIDAPTPQSAIVIGHLGVARDEPDRFAIQLMNDVLGGGSFTSRITERVRSDEGLAYSATSSFSTDERTPGLFQVQVQTKTESTARAIELILEEIEHIRKPNNISSNEFETARDARLYSFALAFSDRSRNVNRVMQRELDGRPANLDEVQFAGLMAAKPDDLIAAANARLKPSELYICVAGDLAKIKDSLAKFGEVNVVDAKELAPPRGGQGARGNGGAPPEKPAEPKPAEPPQKSQGR